MAVIKQRLNRKNSAGTYDTIYPETNSEVVVRPSGVTVEKSLTDMNTAINGKAAASHGTHVTFTTTVPKAAGTAAVGTATTVSRSDHVHPAQTTVSGNAGSATKLTTARTVDGVSFDGSAAITHYGACSTAAATAAKVVACTGFSLVTGSKIAVKFTVTNTASNPTLNVNSTGAKPIYYRGSAIAAGYLAANRTYEFVYNGTQYELIGDIDTNTNTTYTAASTAPKAAGTAAVGTSAKYAREDHVHPAQTSVTGNAGTATKLATARTFRTNLGSTSTASFDGSASVTPGVTGTLPVANGGTGVTSITALKAAMGIGSPTVTAPTYPASVPAVGNTMTWAGKTWRVVHKNSGIAFLILDTIAKSTRWTTINHLEYIGSTIWEECNIFAAANKLYACDYLIHVYGGPVWIPTYHQCNGGFTYFATQSNRIGKLNGVDTTWWTSSPSIENGYIFSVYLSGATGTTSPANSAGFRPCVALRL